MARKSWFDPDSNALAFDQYVEKMESWQEAIADGVIDEAELRGQAERVAALLRTLEPKLTDSQHVELTRIFQELAVLYGMQQLASTTSEE